jgi:hypothetical protein
MGTPSSEDETAMPGRVVLTGQIPPSAGDILVTAGTVAPAGRAGGASPLPIAAVKAAKASLGPIEHLDLTAYDIAQAHYQLGTDVADRVAHFLGHRLGSMDGPSLADEVRRARASRSAVLRVVASAQTPGAIAHAVREYLRCLDAWAAGANLARSAGQTLGGSQVEGVPVGPQDLAFVLQNEGNGCQTGLLREGESSAILWHTEEDREYPGAGRFDKLRLVSFRVGDEMGQREFTGFVYPDLLPGPAFGWSGSTYVHAVDAFYLQPPNGRPGMPANTATWVCLYLGGRFSTSEVAAALGPFTDGYALSSLSVEDGRLSGDTTEFIGNIVHTTLLPDTPGSSVFKVNFLSGPVSRSAPGIETLQPERRGVLERRVARTERALRIVARSEDPIAGLSRLLSSRVGGDFAYANQSVKAHFLCRMATDETSIWVGPGPAVYEDRLFSSAWSPGRRF